MLDMLNLRSLLVQVQVEGGQMGSFELRSEERSEPQTYI